MAGPATLLIVDDHPIFSEGFAAMVRRFRPDWRLQVACSAAEALRLVAVEPPDLAVIDVQLPDMDGLELVRQAMSRWPSLPTLLVSGRDHGVMVRAAQGCGARGFIFKTTPAPEFVAAIERVLSGGTAFGGGDHAPAGLPQLTPRQAEILALVAAGYGNKEIRHRLGIAERTVRAHLTDLFQLLGVHSRMQAVVRGREIGLVE